MADQKEILGEIVIAPEVLEVIVAIATQNVQGVHTLRNRNALNAIGKKSEGRGVYIRSQEEEVFVDIYAYLDYGVKIPKVAREVQSQVKQTIRDTIDIEITEVNIHVMGIVGEKARAVDQPQFEDMFEEGFFDVG